MVVPGNSDENLLTIDHENLTSENWITNFHFGDDSNLGDDTDIDIDENKQDIADLYVGDWRQ